jgi:hypothetical protein
MQDKGVDPRVTGVLAATSGHMEVLQNASMPAATPPAPPAPGDVPPRDTTSPVVPPTSFILLLFFCLGLAASSHASLNIQVPITPTAGSSYIDNTLIVAPSVLKFNAGDLTADINGYAGVQSTWQWGPNYGLGLTLGILAQGIGASNIPTTGKLAGGVVTNFVSLEAGAIWANDGARLILTKLF